MSVRYPIIRVNITKGLKFRALIKETPNDPVYGVTINGKNWNNGVGRHHRTVILEKCNKMLETLSKNVPA